MRPPADRKYSRTHVWALREDGGDVRLGLTHVPARLLGAAVYAELPAVGSDVACGEPVGVVESPGAVFEVVAPLAGTVVAVNRAAEDSPETITADPFGAGWLFTVRPGAAAAADAPTLIDAENYERFAGPD